MAQRSPFKPKPTCRPAWLNKGLCKSSLCCLSLADYCRIWVLLIRKQIWSDIQSWSLIEQTQPVERQVGLSAGYQGTTRYVMWCWKHKAMNDALQSRCERRIGRRAGHAKQSWLSMRFAGSVQTFKICLLRNRDCSRLYTACCSS